MVFPYLLSLCPSLSICPFLGVYTTSLVKCVQVFNIQTVWVKPEFFGVVALFCEVPLVGRVFSPRLPFGSIDDLV